MTAAFIVFWKKDFDETYLPHIRYRCLIMSRPYIEAHFADIRNHAGAIEQRMDDSDLDMENLILENARNLTLCDQHGCEYILIDGEYNISI